jgi:O-antigen/teichoic acid export membrane protein
MIIRRQGVRQHGIAGVHESVTSKELLDYGLRVWVGSIAGVLLLRLDQALIGPLAGTSVLGVYVVAATIADLPLVVNSAVRDVLFSAGSADQREGVLSRAGRISTFLVGGVVVGVGVVLPWGLPALFGGSFASAVPVCWVLLAGLVLSNPGSVAGVGLSSRGRPGLRSWALGAACVVNIALVFALTPTFGAMGAAIATAAGSLAAGWLNIALLCTISSHRPRDFVGVRSTDVASLRSAVGGLLRRA